MSVTIEVEGLQNVRKFLKDKNSKIIRNAEYAVNQASMFLEGEVKASIAGQRAEPMSVDTGQLLNSVGFKSMQLEGEVFSDVEHAKFIEYGTTKIKERRHFRNSANRNKDKIKKYIEDAIKSS